MKTNKIGNDLETNFARLEYACFQLSDNLLQRYRF